jgi:glycosyltransferase involved in cell wall biosynthesis
MRIVHIAGYHLPKDTRIFLKECRSLAKAGYEVHFMVPNPPQEGEVDGVRFHAIEISPHHHMSYWWFLRLWRSLLQIYRDALQLEGQLYHLHEAELIYVGLLLKLRGKKIIFDAHEDFPRQILYLDDGRLHRKLFARLMCFYLTCLIFVARLAFDGFVSTSPKIGERYPAKKTVDCYNYALLDEFPENLLDKAPYNKRPLHVYYVGGITERRGLREMVQAMALLPDDIEVFFIMGGTFRASWFRAQMESLPSWQHVQHLGWQSRESIMEQMTQARVGTVLFQANPHHKVLVPNKLFEYMAGALPVIAADFGHWRKLLGEYSDVPYWIDPSDPRIIANTIMHIFNNPGEAEARGRRGREAVEAIFNWEREAVKLVGLYERLIGTPVVAGSMQNS